MASAKRMAGKSFRFCVALLKAGGAWKILHRLVRTASKLNHCLGVRVSDLLGNIMAWSFLHDNQVNEVNSRCHVKMLLVIIGVDVTREITVGEPQVAEANPLSLQVPIRHGEGCQGLHDTQETICMDDELPVDKSIFLNVTRLAKEHIGLWHLIR